MKPTLLLSAIAALGLAACGGAQESGPTAPGPTPDKTTPQPKAHKTKHKMCPMVDGVTVSAANIDGGVALTWSGTPEQVAMLRRKVRHMVAMHHGGKGHHMMGKHHGMHGRKKMMMAKHKRPGADVSVEDVPAGVRVSFKAKNPADVEKLRAHMTKKAAMMREHRCKMMGMGKGHKPGATKAPPPPAPKPDAAEHDKHHPKP